MIVKISADKCRGRRRYEGAEIRLPANRFALADALQRAQVPEGCGYSLHGFEGCPDFLRTALISCGDKTLEEVNCLAETVSRMDENQLDTYEGIIMLRRDSDLDHPMTIRELINAAYNLDCFEFRPGVTNDRILGGLCIEEDLLEELEAMTDEERDLLDEQKVGSELRRRDQGDFTSKGYIYRCSCNEKEVYDGVRLPEQPERHAGVLSICLKKEMAPAGDGAEVWLELPADRQTVGMALQKLGVPSFDFCAVTGYEGILPLPEGWMADNGEVGKLNVLAERLSAFPDSRTVMKYKAVLELEGYPEIDRMLDITKNLDCYDYDPVIVTAADYGEYVLREAGLDTGDPAFSSFFDFKGYGERQLQQSGFVSTPYGMVIRNGLPFEQECVGMDPAPDGKEGQQMGGMQL